MLSNAIAVFGLIAAVITVVGTVFACYRFVFTKSISRRDIVLNAVWDTTPIRHSENIRVDECLEGRMDESSALVLSLKNRSRVTVRGLRIRAQGNANAKGIPSNFFTAGGSQLRHRISTIVWESNAGVTLRRRPKGLPYNQGLDETELEVGRFSWDRNEGIYYLSLVVSAENMRGRPPEFTISLRPCP